jgi:hypothetical protein
MARARLLRWLRVAGFTALAVTATTTATTTVAHAAQHAAVSSATPTSTSATASQQQLLLHPGGTADHSDLSVGASAPATFMAMMKVCHQSITGKKLDGGVKWRVTVAFNGCYRWIMARSQCTEQGAAWKWFNGPKVRNKRDYSTVNCSKAGKGRWTVKIHGWEYQKSSGKWVWVKSGN